MWRYRELLPLDGEPTVGLHVGGTPLIRADRLAKALGVAELYIKNDAVNHPTLSFKDRVVAVALSKAVELGFQTVGCASTGNLADSVAANAAAAGLEAYVLIPDGLEQGKVLGRHHLRRQGDRHRGQLRPGEPPLLADRLPVRLGVRQRQPPAVLRRGLEDRWASRSPRTWAGGHPTTSSRPMAGGSLIGKIHKAFQRVRAARPDRRPGHDPDVSAPRRPAATRSRPRSRPAPARSSRSATPSTIAKSLAIGDPADGYFASQLIRETGGWSEDVDDDDDRRGHDAAGRDRGDLGRDRRRRDPGRRPKLIEQGKIDRDGSIVLCITGNGLKTQEALIDRLARPVVIKPTLEAFEVARRCEAAATSRSRAAELAVLAGTAA